MKSTTIKGTVEVGLWEVGVEFGSTQAHLGFSNTGKAQRALRLKSGDKVEVTIKKL